MVYFLKIGMRGKLSVYLYFPLIFAKLLAFCGNIFLFCARIFLFWIFFFKSPFSKVLGLF